MTEERVSLGNQGQQTNEQQIPAVSVPLPSGGVVYPKGDPLSGRSLIEIKAMTAKEEDILTSRALLRSGKALDALMRSCVLDRQIDVDGMLSGDRNAVLVAIRITGYGNAYEVTVECPSCSNKVKHEFDLGQLPIIPLGADPVELDSNLFSFKLPVSKKEVRFRLPTGRDERELSVTAERMKKQGQQLESLVTTRLTQQIVSIDGDADGQKIARFVQNMPARDSRDLRTFMDKISPGVDMKQNFECGNCGETQEVDVPMGTEFFWPET